VQIIELRFRIPKDTGWTRGDVSRQFETLLARTLAEPRAVMLDENGQLLDDSGRYVGHVYNPAEASERGFSSR
jgi:hypothetical protein